MNTIKNQENIPSHIFDWMENYNFSSLTELQKKEVLSYFSEEEYDELHHNVMAIKSINEPYIVENSEERKQNLLSRFDTKHKTKKADFVFFNTFWKVAASLLLLGCGWILNYLIPGKTAYDEALVNMVDTVYLTKEINVDPVKIYDTIYVNNDSKTKETYKSSFENRHLAKEPENISSPYLDEVESPLNRQKRNSMKDDSLVKEFTVIML